MLVVSDASSIRALEWGELVQILNSLFDRVVVPPAVAAELARRNGPYRRIKLSRCDFIHVTQPQNLEFVQGLSHILDPGESEALASASEVPDSLLLIDEESGRRQARKMNLQVVGTVGILVTARQRELIPAIGPILEVLRTELRFFLSDDVIDAADRPLSTQRSGTLVSAFQAASFVIDGVARLFLSSCLKRKHKRRGSCRFCQGS